MVEFSKSSLLVLVICWAGCLGFAWLVPTEGLVKFLPLGVAAFLSYAVISNNKQLKAERSSQARDRQAA